MVDDEDYQYLMQFNWNVAVFEHTCYAQRNAIVDGKKVTVRMYWEIMKKQIEETGIKRIDHIDHNGLNCQKYNMRIATHADNMKNKTSAKNTSSKYLGVCKHKGNGMWEAYIKIEGRQTYLGGFTNEELAARAYDKKAKGVYKEFANLNFK